MPLAWGLAKGRLVLHNHVFSRKGELFFFPSNVKLILSLYFLLLLFFSGILQSCVKFDSLEPCEDLDSPAEESEEEKEEIVTLVIEKPKEKWDCESILSKYFGALLLVLMISK